MKTLILAFFISCIINLLIMRLKGRHLAYFADSNFKGPQKFHKEIVPRVGGIGIAIGLVGILFLIQGNLELTAIEMPFFICAVPCLAIGLLEDITKRIGVKVRLLITAIGAMCASVYLGVSITNLGIINLADFPYGLLISYAFTVFALTGMSNAYNMIDGFNGLSSMVGIITFIALGYMGFLFSDWPIVNISLAFIGSILGFFIWNYPRGSIFLGDGGAYLIGYGVGLQTILLVTRHPEISPWFAILINAYPILEALFTIYRRLIHQRKNPGDADGIHFHSLIFRRILNRAAIKDQNDLLNANARTSPYLWILTSLAIIPAVFFCRSSATLIFCITLFVITYLYLYTNIVRFKTPFWMHPPY